MPNHRTYASSIIRTCTHKMSTLIAQAFDMREGFPADSREGRSGRTTEFYKGVLARVRLFLPECVFPLVGYSFLLVLGSVFLSVLFAENALATNKLLLLVDDPYMIRMELPVVCFFLMWGVTVFLLIFAVAFLLQTAGGFVRHVYAESAHSCTLSILAMVCAACCACAYAACVQKVFGALRWMLKSNTPWSYTCAIAAPFLLVQAYNVIELLNLAKHRKFKISASETFVYAYILCSFVIHGALAFHCFRLSRDFGFIKLTKALLGQLAAPREGVKLRLQRK
ncbi:uncharacterized protein NEMAJ01_0297 [Nematocida major]|uniref:uncharacterized protein n=1 Tax=Nematocida major TaxID=1912982 RepID=UPI00200727C4|nr:uncharacterized protein NEMAJ01_0297 [Nematocida major]KAH9385401.1 hypothetical protein NEMAJ01_0297 [Nematocida major]